MAVHEPILLKSINNPKSSISSTSLERTNFLARVLIDIETPLHALVNLSAHSYSSPAGAFVSFDSQASGVYKAK